MYHQRQPFVVVIKQQQQQQQKVVSGAQTQVFMLEAVLPALPQPFSETVSDTTFDMLPSEKRSEE